MDPNSENDPGQSGDILKIVSSLKEPFEDRYSATVEAFISGLSRNNLTPEVLPVFKEYLLRRGKRIRPLLFCAGYSIFHPSGRPFPEALFRPAIGLELFHNFVLIHDDIIDGASTRRGLPSLQAAIADVLSCTAQRGEHLALVLGDILFSQAVEQFHGPDYPAGLLPEFLRLVRETGAGEAVELIDTGRTLKTISEEKITRTYYYKTTRYTFESPLQMGALCAGAGPEKQDAIARLTKPLGLAFQIENDLHELRQQDRALESVALDLQAGIKTLVLKRFFDQASKEDQAFIEQLSAAAECSPQSLEQLVISIRNSSVLQELEAETNALFLQSRGRATQSEFQLAEQHALKKVIGYLRGLSHHTEALLPAHSK